VEFWIVLIEFVLIPANHLSLPPPLPYPEFESNAVPSDEQPLSSDNVTTLGIAALIVALKRVLALAHNIFEII
jgi:hypothetical protein